MDTLADFVADEDDIPRAAADERRQRRALAQDHLVGVAAQQAIGHPDRHAVDEYRVGPAVELVERTNQVERFLDRLRVRWPRSEEHTSELQSRLHLVCRLLLEKKK